LLELIGFIDRLQKLNKAGRFIDGIGAFERRPQDIQIALGEKPHRYDPVFHILLLM